MDGGMYAIPEAKSICPRLTSNLKFEGLTTAQPIAIPFMFTLRANARMALMSAGTPGSLPNGGNAMSIL